MSGLSKSEVEDFREVFDLFDFWDGRDGEVDSAKVGDVVRCLGMNPTVEMSVKHGGARKFGEKNYKFEELLAIYQAISKEKEFGTIADFVEGFKTFDREGQGFVSLAEIRHILTAMAEKLTQQEMDQILQFTETNADNEGNIKYEEFIKKVMNGPFEK